MPTRWWPYRGGMSIPTAGLPLTAHESPRVGVVPHTGSTNADLVAAAADEEAYPHLSLIVTDDQRRGRGRLGRDWVAPAGSSIACSVLLRVPGLPLAARGWIPLAAGLGLHGALSTQLRGHNVVLKWPNDVLVDGKKICGILAEATLERDAVVVGFGVNTDMTIDQLPVDTATSFAALGETCDVDRLLSDVVRSLATSIEHLRTAGGDAGVSGLHREVNSVCATVGSSVRVSLPDGSTLIGTAEAVAADGRLEVRDVAGTLVEVSAGDVTHVRPA